MDQKKHSCGKRRRYTVLLLMMVLCLSVPVPAAGLSPQVELPVTVSLTGGEPSRAEGYTLCLTPIDRSPMPHEAELVLTEPCSASFPPISYAAVGVYRYRISQLPGDDPDTHYDASVYDVTVTVTNSSEGDGLEATVVLMKDGKKQSSATFTNDRTPTSHSDPGTLIQTGRDRLPILGLGIAGGALIVLGAMLLWRRGGTGSCRD